MDPDGIRVLRLHALRTLLSFVLVSPNCACIAPECVDSTEEVASSPDGKFIATEFIHNCGATTPYVTAVVLHPVGESINTSNPANWIFSVRGKVPVHLEWIDGRVIRVSGRLREQDVREMRTEWQSVVIEYKFD